MGVDIRVLPGPLRGLDLFREAAPTMPTSVTLAFMGWDLVLVLTLEIRILSSWTIN